MHIAAPLTLGLSVFLLVGGANAPRHELVMKDHHILKGTVVSSTEDSVTFEHVVGDTKDTTAYSADIIDPHSFYLVRQEAVGEDAAAKVKLGEYCMANGLFTRARNQFIEAQHIDGSLSLNDKMAVCREGTADQILAKAQAQMDKGDQHGAYRSARSIIRSFPDTDAADKAREMAGGLGSRFDAQFAAQQAGEEDRRWEKKLDEVRKLIQRAAQNDSKGNSEPVITTGKRFFDTSVRMYSDAMKELDQLAKEAQGNDKIQAEIAELSGHAKTSLAAVHVDVGSIYAGQTDYSAAAASANAALEVDPDNAEAKSLRANAATSGYRNGGVMIYAAEAGAVRRR